MVTTAVVGGVDVASLMAATPLMAGSDPTAVASLAAAGRVRSFRRGAYLFHQQDESDNVYLVCEGQVEISSVSPAGTRQWHTTLTGPQFFGELGVLAGVGRMASALAVDDVVAWSVDGERFLDFLDRDKAASRALMVALARQVHAYGGLVDDLLYLDLRARVAKRLLGLATADLDDLPPDGTPIPSIVTHADIAGLAGGSRENVSRLLSEFQRRGILGKDGRRLVLQDVSRLAKLAGLR